MWSIMTEVKEKSKAGRKCSICTHEQVDQINTDIYNRVSFRGISLKYGMSDMSVARHTHDCLELELQTLIKEHKIAQAINVHDEFAEQLAFAKTLRDTAQMYLSDPDDPFGLFIGPQAHEIDVTYYDFNDLEEVGSGENMTLRPKKKKAKLNDILAEMAGKGLESSRVEIKTLDIRKYALDAISTADVCIDKFARMGGAYQKDRRNERDPAQLMEDLVNFLVSKGHDRAVAIETARKKYATAPLQLSS